MPVSYFWGDAGRGSEKGFWWESQANESCVLQGRQAVTVLLDLFKCFQERAEVAVSSIVAQVGVPVLSSSSSSTGRGWLKDSKLL